MERFDVSEGDRLADMVSRAERGEPVEITRDGAVVARLTGVPRVDVSALEALHRTLPPQVFGLEWLAGLNEVRRGRFE